MNTSIFPRLRRQAGASAVELAIVLSATIVLLPSVALFAKVFFLYSVMKEATRDAAAYMSSETEGVLRDPDQMARARDVARQMVVDAAVASGLAAHGEVSEVSVHCDGFPCLGAAFPPVVYEVSVTFAIEDVLFAGLTGNWTNGEHKWVIGAKSSMPHTN